MKKRIFACAMVATMSLSLALTGCGGSDSSDSSDKADASSSAEGSAADSLDDGSGNADDTWAIYWYMCGSDLESQYGAASMDIDEMEEVTLPSNVKVVIETGGSNGWTHSDISADSLCRFVYDSDGLTQTDQVDSADMGESSTLSDFITYCTSNYDADHKILVFWNHGGGSAGGVCYDEKYEYDCLNLYELSEAFAASASEKEFDIVGFDTCLMATLDNASVIEPYANYMVASEESEPGCGWLYSSWLQTLADNTGISPAKLGASICDSFLSGCADIGQDDTATLSVTDLSQIAAVKTKTNLFSIDMLTKTCTEQKSLT